MVKLKLVKFKDAIPSAETGVADEVATSDQAPLSQFVVEPDNSVAV